MDKAIDYEKQAIDYSSVEEFKAGSLMNIAWRYFKIKDYQKALDNFKQVVDEYPASAQAKEALLRVGDMFGYLGKQDEAIKTFNIYLNKYPNDPELASVKMKIAWSYYNKGDYEKAAEAFKRVLEEHPQSPESKEALMQMGNAYANMGKNEEAIKAFQAFIDKYPQDERVPEAMMNLAWRYRLLDKEKEKEVLLELNKRYPDTELGWFALGLYYQDSGDLERAIEQFKRAIEFHGSQRPISLFSLASCYYDIGEYDLAIQTFQQLLEEYGENVGRNIKRGAMLYWGKCYEHKIDYSSAIKRYSLLLKELSPKETLYQTTKIRIGYCYLQLGEFQKALQTWEELLKEIPANSVLQGITLGIVRTYSDLTKPSDLPPAPKKGISTKIIGPIDQIGEFGNEYLKGDVLVLYGEESQNKEENSASFLAARMYAQETGKLFGLRTPLKLKKDTEISSEDLKNNNIVIFGNPRTTKLLATISPYLPIRIGDNRIEVADRVYEGKDLGVIMLVPNPYNRDKFVMIYCAFNPSLLESIQYVFHGPTDYVIFSQKALNDSNALLEQGFFFKVSPEKWIAFPSSPERTK
ncbi:tetratricopeptide repeat protein [bacterium]|nr:tetratricopeptide repeat protein [bacterium]